MIGSCSSAVSSFNHDLLLHLQKTDGSGEWDCDLFVSMSMHGGLGCGRSGDSHLTVAAFFQCGFCL